MGVLKAAFGTFGGLVLFFIGLPALVILVVMVRAELRDAPGGHADRGAVVGSVYEPEIRAAAAQADAVVQLRKVQRALAARGYDPGPADGRLTDRTQAAIRAFERDNGLTETGQPGLRVSVLLSLD
jgi:dihydroxyacetone kinase